MWTKKGWLSRGGGEIERTHTLEPSLTPHHHERDNQAAAPPQATAQLNHQTTASVGGTSAGKPSDVRPDGGSASQCSGSVDTPYHGSGASNLVAGTILCRLYRWAGGDAPACALQPYGAISAGNSTLAGERVWLAIAECVIGQSCRGRHSQPRHRRFQRTPGGRQSSSRCWHNGRRAGRGPRRSPARQLAGPGGLRLVAALGVAVSSAHFACGRTARRHSCNCRAGANALEASIYQKKERQ